MTKCLDRNKKKKREKREETIAPWVTLIKYAYDVELSRGNELIFSSCLCCFCLRLRIQNSNESHFILNCSLCWICTSCCCRYRCCRCRCRCGALLKLFSPLFIFIFFFFSRCFNYSLYECCFAVLVLCFSFCWLVNGIFNSITFIKYFNFYCSMSIQHRRIDTHTERESERYI